MTTVGAPDVHSLPPMGRLGLIAMPSVADLANNVDFFLKQYRTEMIDENPDLRAADYIYQETFRIPCTCVRFANGEGKVTIDSSVRGHDIFILADVGNYSQTFKMFGMDVPMTPDDHYQDIKRAISAIEGRSRRITLVTPLLYGSRQHKRTGRESLDCAVSLQELINMGVDNIITFDAHDPRVQNAIPLRGFDNMAAHYQFIKAMLRTIPDLQLTDRNRIMIISPDEGAVGRNLYFASILGLDLGLFYKRRDYTHVVDGRNPIVAHEYMGDDVEGKDIIIVDDMISSGDSMLDIIVELKKRNAGRILLCTTFPMFTNGVKEFDDAHRAGLFDYLFSTNLTYRRPELLAAPWYVDVDMSKFIALIMHTLNFDRSMSPLVDPSDRILRVLKQYKLR